MKKISTLLVSLCLFVCIGFSCVQPAFAALSATKKITVSTVTPESVTINWTKVSGAKGYRVYRYNYDKKSWSSVKNTTSVSYNDKAVQPGKCYAYRVRAYTTSSGKNVYGDYSATVYVNVPAGKVTNVRTYNVTSDSITLQWNKAAGATGYVVYRYDSATKKYIRVGTTEKNYLQIKGISNIYGSCYRVRAYSRINKSNVYAEYSDLYTNKIALSNINSIKISKVTQSSYRISWDKVNGADGYQVYRYDSSTKKWTRIKNTSSEHINLSGFSSGIKYSYKIRAYSSKNGAYRYGNYSESFEATTLPSAPTKLTVTANKYKGLTLKWNAVSGATGYLIYSYESVNGKWILLGTSTKNYYYNNNLSQTRNYTYRVKAFITIADVNYYGPLCESASAFYQVQKQENETIAKLEKSGIFGYLYDPAEVCFYTSGDPWQRNIGYNEVFDWCAPLTLINFDTERLYFNYKNKDWLVQLWKGQYGLAFYGAEVGVYYKPTDRDIDHFDCVSDDDMLKMSMDFYLKSSSTGKWSKKFSRPYGEYWWCTGFLAGNIGTNFDRLRFVLRITMEDAEMLRVFRQALNKNKLSYTVDGLDVYIDYK